MVSRAWSFFGLPGKTIGQTHNAWYTVVMHVLTTNLSRAMLALILGALLALQFWSLRAPRPLHLPAQQQVATTNPKIGIHTRLTGLGDEQYIHNSLQQVREMGAGWIVDLFPWAYAQPR